GVWLWLLDEVGYLPEDADDVLAPLQRDRAHLDRDAPAVPVYEHHRAVGRVGVAEEPASEELLCPSRLLRRDDGRELPPSPGPDEAAPGRVHPADHAGAVDQIARDVDVLDRLRHIYLERLELRERHLGSVARRAAASQLALCRAETITFGE